MTDSEIIRDAAKAYVKSPRVGEICERVSVFANRKVRKREERRQVRIDAREQLRLSVDYYDMSLIGQLSLLLTIASWVSWIMKQVFDD